MKEYGRRFLSERKPKEIQNLRILDPACGSGSFLIRAYKELEGYYQHLKKEAWEKRQKALAKVYEDQVSFLLTKDRMRPVGS